MIQRDQCARHGDRHGPECVTRALRSRRSHARQAHTHHSGGLVTVTGHGSSRSSASNGKIPVCGVSSFANHAHSYPSVVHRSTVIRGPLDFNRTKSPGFNLPALSVMGTNRARLTRRVNCEACRAQPSRQRRARAANPATVGQARPTKRTPTVHRTTSQPGLAGERERQTVPVPAAIRTGLTGKPANHPSLCQHSKGPE